MAIDRGDPAPLYQQLAATLRARIAKGDLDGRVPSINDLSADYDVARATVQKALRLLADEGLIVVSPGRGFFVRRG